jgi:hypothetical protein
VLYNKFDDIVKILTTNPFHVINDSVGGAPPPDYLLLVDDDGNFAVDDDGHYLGVLKPF